MNNRLFQATKAKAAAYDRLIDALESAESIEETITPTLEVAPIETERAVRHSSDHPTPPQRSS